MFSKHECRRNNSVLLVTLFCTYTKKNFKIVMNDCTPCEPRKSVFNHYILVKLKPETLSL